MVTLFPSALCIGATFPFAVRVLARRGDDAGPASARVYAANTAGSIAGSVCAGFFLVPGLGFAGTLIACVAINLVLAAAASLLVGPWRRGLAAIAWPGPSRSRSRTRDAVGDPARDLARHVPRVGSGRLFRRGPLLDGAADEPAHLVRPAHQRSCPRPACRSRRARSSAAA
jgi:spermidine synthase